MKKVYGGLFIFITLIILNIALGGLTVQYTLNYWVPKITHEKFEAKFWPCAVAGLFLGEISIPAAAITWLVEDGQSNK